MEQPISFEFFISFVENMNHTKINYSLEYHCLIFALYLNWSGTASCQVLKLISMEETKPIILSFSHVSLNISFIKFKTLNINSLEYLLEWNSHPQHLNSVEWPPRLKDPAVDILQWHSANLQILPLSMILYWANLLIKWQTFTKRF